MKTDATTIALIAAGAALSGVVCGTLLEIVRDWLSDRRARRMEEREARARIYRRALLAYRSLPKVLEETVVSGRNEGEAQREWEELAWELVTDIDLHGSRQVRKLMEEVRTTVRGLKIEQAEPGTNAFEHYRAEYNEAMRLPLRALTKAMRADVGGLAHDAGPSTGSF